ncbi:hypothetical protein ESO86_18490 [Agromyces binzhouensis]|uniref:Uncharacterized protein n=1 Tax=Agromyces binzhouensis TaxID=1817495 RepID=A0A4Q2J1M6_9MICO|nr:hypothetical protein ESO86_18490 [Agromyces binzhouensis]
MRRIDLGPVRTIQDADPPWFAHGTARLPGRVLAEVGLPMPLLAPEQALVFELLAERADRSGRGADGDAPAAG